MKIISVLCVMGLMAASVPVRADDTLPDPFEGYNRVIFSVNDTLDQVLLTPLAKGYRAVVPNGVRTGVHNALNNLKSPLTIGNQLLQGDLSGAGDATVRMIVNTFVGVGGIFDVAAAEGIEDEAEDFGQTLAVWGVGHGPYIVPPILPPASLRDHTGALVDTYADPVRMWMMDHDHDGLYIAKVGLSALDTRTELLDTLADLKRSSIDYYATIRSAYVQRRAALVADGATNMSDYESFDE
jgi:phospholipid-binding lipoprotein MlaA